MYHSFDEAVDDSKNYYPHEIVNTSIPNGCLHVLKLKKNCPIILLQNIDSTNELCNVMRLVVCDFQKNVPTSKLS
jgi:hypothetical protein